MIARRKVGFESIVKSEFISQMTSCQTFFWSVGIVMIHLRIVCVNSHRALRRMVEIVTYLQSSLSSRSKSMK